MLVNYFNNWSVRVALQWGVAVIFISLVAGTMSAGFLFALNWVTNYRDANFQVIYFLPAAGLILGLLYKYLGSGIERGNDLVFDTIHSKKDIVPVKMAPLVLIGTLITHLFGGSAGREGTALQMSAAVGSQFAKISKLNAEAKNVLLISALSAGFASVFGTPIAGVVFGLEVLLLGKIPLKAVIPAVVCSFLATWITDAWGIHHTHYLIQSHPQYSLKWLFLVSISAILFGLAAVLFVSLSRAVSHLSRLIRYEPLRPMLGGGLVLVIILAFDTEQYSGLGIPVILNAFEIPSAFSAFAWKILLTALTLGFGFKGGEVTPLFFVGATLGSALSQFLPVPTDLLAGIGFVAVFAAATKTPVASCVLAIEVFGFACLPYAILACAIAYLTSGPNSIYNTPNNREPEHFIFGVFRKPFL